MYSSVVCVFTHCQAMGIVLCCTLRSWMYLTIPLTMSTCRILFRIFSPKPGLLGASYVSGTVYLSLSFQDPNAPSWIGGLHTMCLLGGV